MDHVAGDGVRDEKRNPGSPRPSSTQGSRRQQGREPRRQSVEHFLADEPPKLQRRKPRQQPSLQDSLPNSIAIPAVLDPAAAAEYAVDAVEDRAGSVRLGSLFQEQLWQPRTKLPLDPPEREQIRYFQVWQAGFSYFVEPRPRQLI